MFFWIPEAPNHNGVYARDPKKPACPTFGEVSTMDPHNALRFITEDECASWCKENSSPVFVPREHGFVSF